MKSFADTCWDWSEIKVEIEESLKKIDQGFAGDPAQVEVYVEQLLGAADELKKLRLDLIDHAHLMVPSSRRLKTYRAARVPPLRGARTRRAATS